MTQFLFPNFLQDVREYEQSEALWKDRWGDLVRRERQDWLWGTPWASATFVDGTPIRDGNPIFYVVSPQRRLGIRVIQLEPAANPRELQVWTDTFAQGDPEELKELVVCCVLTHLTLLEAVDLMARWVREEEAGLTWENKFLGALPIARSTQPKRLELAVA